MQQATALFSLLFISLFATPVSFAASTEAWTGSYSYESKKNRTPVKFDLTWKKSGKKLRGKIIEANTFGDNGFDKLQADLRGEMNSDGEVKFTKTYDGTAGVSHSVEYRGRLNPEKTKISGQWQIKDVTGPFVMEKAPSPEKNQAKK